MLKCAVAARACGNLSQGVLQELRELQQKMQAVEFIIQGTGQVAFPEPAGVLLMFSAIAMCLLKRRRGSVKRQNK